MLLISSFFSHYHTRLNKIDNHDVCVTCVLAILCTVFSCFRNTTINTKERADLTDTAVAGLSVHHFFHLLRYTYTEALLLQTDRATCCVSRNLVN